MSYYFPEMYLLKTKSLNTKFTVRLCKITNGDSLILYFKCSLISEILLTLALWKCGRKKWFCLPCCLLLEVLSIVWQKLNHYPTLQIRKLRQTELLTEIVSQSLPLIYQLWKQLSNPIPFTAMLLRNGSTAKASQWRFPFSKILWAWALEVQKCRYQLSKT